MDLLYSLTMTFFALVATLGELLLLILLSPMRARRLRKEQRRWIVAGRVLRIVSDAENRLNVPKISL